MNVFQIREKETCRQTNLIQNFDEIFVSLYAGSNLRNKHKSFELIFGYFHKYLSLTIFTLLKIKMHRNKKYMKPFHIDRELEQSILFKNVVSYLRTSYLVVERPNTVLERPILF